MGDTFISFGDLTKKCIESLLRYNTEVFLSSLLIFVNEKIRQPYICFVGSINSKYRTANAGILYTIPWDSQRTSFKACLQGIG